MACQPELALLGHDSHSATFRDLRDSSLGTPTLRKAQTPPSLSRALGETCSHLLDAIRRHPSRASERYYLKTYEQYSVGLLQSLSETSRVCRSGAKLAVVVQSSWYKELHVDLAAIVSEMLSSLGWTSLQRTDFRVRQTLADTNPSSRAYRSRHGSVESVLEFLKG